MSNEIISNQDLLISNMLEIEAIVRILTRRGITNEDEILKEVEKLKIEMNEKIRRMSKEN
ncbi:MAG: hypothetical protein D8M26_00725 [Ignavibacteriae bacterium]|nr:hypothetical protein [Ignavibacteriota bacterium]